MLFFVEEDIINQEKENLIKRDQRGTQENMRHTFAKTIKKKLKENKHNLIRSLSSPLRFYKFIVTNLITI